MKSVRSDGRRLVALDCRGLAWPGIGRYCRELAAALPEVAPDLEFRWLCSAAQAEQLPRNERAYPVVLRTAPISVGEQVEVVRALRRLGVGLLHAPASFTVPLLAPRLVVTVHDFILRRFPEFLPSLPGRAYHRMMNHLSISRASKVITVSDFTRADVLRFWRGVAAKTHTIPNGVSAAFRPVRDASVLDRVRASQRLPENFVLYIGTRKRHKNLVRLIEAYAGVPESLRLLNPLVLVTPPDPRYPEVEEAVRGAGIQESVLWRLPLADEELPAVYSMARFLVLPSLMEGFGLPLLEAMACGTPSLAARAGALPEVGGEASWYADPLDVADLRRGLIRLMEDAAVRKDLSERGLLRVRSFDWRKTASEVAGLYREVLSSSPT